MCCFLSKAGSDYTLVGVNVLLKEYGATTAYVGNNWGDLLAYATSGTNIYCEFKPDWGSSYGNGAFQIGVSNAGVYTNIQQYNNISSEQTCTFTKQSTDSIVVKVARTDGLSSPYYRGVDYFKIYLRDPTLKKTGENVHLRTFNGLGFINSFTTFGRHIDGTRITHE